MKEIKIDLRSFSRDPQEVRTIAITAENEARRANNRIDHIVSEETKEG